MALVMVFAMTPSMTVFAEDGDPEAVDPETLEWQDVAVPMKPSDIPDYTHRQYYVNQQLLYNHYYAIKRAEIEADPEKYGDYTEEDIDRESALYALDILAYIEKSTIGIRPDDPVYHIRIAREDIDRVYYLPRDLEEFGFDDLSPFILEYHDYYDECDWNWIDEDHVTAAFTCFLGTEEHGDGTGDTVVYELSGSDIEKKTIREATENRDGEMECTASVDFLLFQASGEIKTYTDTHIFTIPATGDPRRLTITKQPEDQALRYPEGATFHVEVDDPGFVRSYQWYDTDAEGKPVRLDGLTAATDTLILPSTGYFDSTFDLFCVVTDRNGNKVTSEPAHVDVVNNHEHKPVFYVGEYALEPGDKLDLSATRLGSGTVTFDPNGNEVTLDNIRFSTDGFLFDTPSAPATGLFAACSGCTFDDGEFTVHVKGDCVVNNNYYDAEHYSGGVDFVGHFRASDVDADVKTLLVIDGDGRLELNGGSRGISTDSPLEIDAGFTYHNHKKDYGEAIYSGGILYVDKDANLDIRSFGPGIFTEGELYVYDGASVKIDATAPHVYSRVTELYGIVANGNMHLGDAKMDIDLHAIKETMFPYDGTIGGMTGICAYDIELQGTRVSIDIDAEKGDEPYAQNVFGIHGDALRGVYLDKGAKVDIKIDADIVSDVTEGIASGEIGNITLNPGTELNVDVRASGTVNGIDISKPLEVTDAKLKVSAESTTEDAAVFGILCPGTKINLSTFRDWVKVSAKDGVAIFANDQNSDTEYVPDYDPQLIVLQGEAQILTPEKGEVNRYGFPFRGSVIPGESIYDPASTEAPASEVVITVAHDCPSKDFTDVGLEDWFHEAVDYVVEKGLMNGVGKSKFDPNSTTTRAMIVTILYRLENSPDSGVQSSVSFEDVEPGSWYEEAVNWAAANGIVNGYSKTKFGPADPITREQFAAILYRYNKMGDGASGSKLQALSSYTDADEISDWAKEAMDWCVTAGIITGVTDTTLVPKGKSTRAQAATMLMRYCKSN